MSYVIILHAFLVRREICALFFGLRKTVRISKFCQLRSKILSYINIFFSHLIFVYNKYLVLIQTCSRTIVDLK